MVTAEQLVIVKNKSLLHLVTQVRLKDTISRDNRSLKRLFSDLTRAVLSLQITWPEGRLIEKTCLKSYA